MTRSLGLSPVPAQPQARTPLPPPQTTPPPAPGWSEGKASSLSIARGRIHASHGDWGSPPPGSSPHSSCRLFTQPVASDRPSAFSHLWLLLLLLLCRPLGQNPSLPSPKRVIIIITVISTIRVTQCEGPRPDTPLRGFVSEITYPTGPGMRSH